LRGRLEIRCQKSRERFPGFLFILGVQTDMAGEEEKREGKGFTVQDRRRFSPDTGEVREDAAESADAAKAEATSDRAQPEINREGRQETLAEINFSTFVISLSTQALMNLGEIANPISGKVETDVAVAKQMIDILGILREKTRGNLNAGEERLMEDILFDLRMKYVEAVKRK
jgi:hypothetical protein